MSKTTKTVAEPKSGAPMLIIGGVFLLAILGAWYFYNNSKVSPAANNSNSVANANKAKATPIPANAHPGAQPPNQTGASTASVKLEEFADFQCGSCAAAHPVLNEIKSMYGSRIHFIFRNFPLNIPDHDKSYDAAVAVEAAGLQSPNKFWEMQNLLFTNQQAWTKNPNYKQMWKGYADKIGLDVAKWENDMVGMPAKLRVDADMARGKALNVSSTPTLYLNGQLVNFSEMNVTALKGYIDAELQKGAVQSNTAAPSPDTSNNADSNK